MELDPLRRLILEASSVEGRDLKAMSLHIGKNPTYMHQFVHKGSPRRLAAEDRLKLAVFLELPASALTEGLPDNVMAAELPTLPLEANVQPFDGRLPARLEMPDDVPVLGTAVGGDDGHFILNGQPADYIRRPPGLAGARKAFAVIANGISMVPAFDHGDPAYVNPARPPWIGDHVVVELVSEDEAPGLSLLKKLVKKTPKGLFLGQYNPPREDIFVPASKVKACWRVVPLRELLMV